MLSKLNALTQEELESIAGGVANEMQTRRNAVTPGANIPTSKVKDERTDLFNTINLKRHDATVSTTQPSSPRELFLNNTQLRTKP